MVKYECGANFRRTCNNDCSTCYERSFASHHKKYLWSSQNIETPRNVLKFSNKRYWFECKQCNHTWITSLNNVTNGDTGCPYCSNNKLCNNEDCKICFTKSFASHPKAEFWHIDNTKRARDVFKVSGKFYLFNCICGHTFMGKPSKITSENNWCPYCGKKELCTSNNCEMCFNNSFASQYQHKYWSKKNKKRPRDVFKSCGKKFIFDCSCGHEFAVGLNTITSKHTWCPYCSNRKLCNSEDCNQCLESSFASHPKSKFWSDQNKVKPRNVFLSAKNKYKFICNKEHTFSIRLYSIVAGSWCPYCMNKTEGKLLKFLKDKYEEVKPQFKVKWCKNENNNYLPFDFLLPTLYIIIELDGEQHFSQLYKWKSPEETQKIDKYKMKMANNNGYTVIRILQDDVWNDKNNWKNKLVEAIKKYDEPTYIFIEEGSKYDCYLE